MAAQAGCSQPAVAASPLRQQRIRPWRRRAAPGAHGKGDRQQWCQQQHPQAVLDQHLGGHPRAGLLDQAGFLRFDLAEQIGLQGRQAEALIRRREGRNWASRACCTLPAR